MEVIPVLDLKDGAVVHAKMGRRAQYRPIKTPLATTSDPVDVARGLLSLYAFETFYIADLDAIERKGDNDTALKGLRSAFPQLTFWVDNGLAELDRARCWLAADLGHLVLGTETQRDDGVVRRLRADDRVILSLDYRDEFVGPAALLSNPDAWPNRVIAMTLARVGSAMGPQWDRLSAIKARAPAKRIYAAGGVRGADDLIALANAGIAGALVASCLHDGKLSGEQIATMAGVQ
jgi:phosphoribosylformimino-5-aminoimidazole carboxamide ribotide isomerase